MNKIVSLILLVGGVVLIVVGINATNSFGSDVSKFFTGSRRTADLSRVKQKPDAAAGRSTQLWIRDRTAYRK